jgi:hypothetical protein
MGSAAKVKLQKSGRRVRHREDRSWPVRDSTKNSKQGCAEDANQDRTVEFS